MSRSVTPLIAVLAYHKVGPHPDDWETWFYVPEETLARQLDLMRGRGWEPLSWERFLRGLDEPESLPERGMLVTFDDGYRSLCESVPRRLAEFECPAVAFIATDYLGAVNSFDRGIEPEEAMCDRPDLERLQRLGFSIQSHTASHRPLSELSDEEQRHELEHSKRVLEDWLGSQVTGLSYPYGDPGGEARSLEPLLAAAGYRAAFLYDDGVARAPIRERFRIPRLAIGPDTDLSVELGHLGNAWP